jgi:hypothetical protein
MTAAQRLTPEQASGEKVQNANPARSKKACSVAPPRLERLTFVTSREMDFFSEKELVTQTGHELADWPLVFVKELLDNAIDACEEADVAPVIEVTADETGISVSDNGPGLPESTLKAAMNFSVRASNREAYVSPTRGAQGNALKTLLAMPLVVDPDHGRLIVQAHGKRHSISCGADPISQRAVIHDDIAELPTSGTLVRIEWRPQPRNGGEVVWPFDSLEPCWKNWDPFADHFRDLVLGFAVFNPHATIHLDWFGTRTVWEATDPSWQKWKPSRPTSPHWYEQSHLERLIGAYITHDRDAGREDRLVSDFLGDFDGLSRSGKRARVLRDTGLKRVPLSALVVGDRFDRETIAKLLAAMQRHTRPVKSAALGIIGEDHLRARLEAMGVLPESFQYSRKLAKSTKRESGPDQKPCFLPGVLESAFGYLGPAAKEQRRIFAGANWSAALGNPFRSFGSTGEGLETILARQEATGGEPVVFVLHLAHPRVEYRDRGKSSITIGGDS